MVEKCDGLVSEKEAAFGGFHLGFWWRWFHFIGTGKLKEGRIDGQWLFVECSTGWLWMNGKSVWWWDNIIMRGMTNRKIELLIRFWLWRRRWLSWWWKDGFSEDFVITCFGFYCYFNFFTYKCDAPWFSHSAPSDIVRLHLLLLLLFPLSCPPTVLNGLNEK